MKKLPSLVLFVFLAVLMASPADLMAAKRRNVTGTIFNDPNGNNRLDNNEKGGQPAAVWLYRILPNGKRRKIGRVGTDQAGNYLFKNVRAGKYFIAVRYNNSKLAVRTRTFTIGGGSNADYRANIPYVTRQTVNNYNKLSVTSNPANLDEDDDVTPFTP